MGNAKKKSKKLDGLVVGTSPKVPARIKAWVGYGLLLIFAVVLLIGGANRYRQSQNQHAQQAQQEAAIVKQAELQLYPLNTASLKPTVKSILDIKGYQSNSNYLYILTVYYMSIGDVNSAQTYLNKLQSRYASYPPDQQLINTNGNLTTLQKGLTQAQAQSKQIRSSFTGFH